MNASCQIRTTSFTCCLQDLLQSLQYLSSLSISSANFYKHTHRNSQGQMDDHQSNTQVQYNCIFCDPDQFVLEWIEEGFVSGWCNETKRIVWLLEKLNLSTSSTKNFSIEETSTYQLNHYFNNLNISNILSSTQ